MKLKIIQPEPKSVQFLGKEQQEYHRSWNWSSCPPKKKQVPSRFVFFAGHNAAGGETWVRPASATFQVTGPATSPHRAGYLQVRITFKHHVSVSKSRKMRLDVVEIYRVNIGHTVDGRSPAPWMLETLWEKMEKTINFRNISQPSTWLLVVLGCSIDWFQGKSSPETIRFPKYGVFRCTFSAPEEKQSMFLLFQR